MLAPHIKRKVDQLWNSFWTAGITNPLVAVEQITYLLFLKRLETLDRDRVKRGKTSIYKDAEECRWSFIRLESDPVHLRDVVFPWLRELEKRIEKPDKSKGEAGAKGKKKPDEQPNGIEAVGERMTDAYFQLDPKKGAILKEAVHLIDGLFDRADTFGASDIMGDTFEYLLSRIQTAGLNGQFRTPRQIIRLMVALLDPQPGEKLIDPAAGTGGFLFSALRHILMKNTDPENLRIEWDGTPHRAYGDQFSPGQYDFVLLGEHYVGFDNDRTMVRIGWMNLILHGIENPQIHQRDTLSKRRTDDRHRERLQSETYRYVLANPPFTGKVDSDDLAPDIYPRAAKSGKRASQPITTKSELLFVWLMLDLLDIGGRCAVIVPEGVLFGNTDAHKALRRELLTEHLVEAVISLPGGVFQPYTGVKTSVLVFQKETRKANRNDWKPAKMPRTRNVWFYEVGEEALSLDAKRAERKGLNNDLWDVVEKFKRRHDSKADDLAYFQPAYHIERWRMVDDHTMKVFAEEPEVQRCKGKIRAIHELFSELPDDLEYALKQIDDDESPSLKRLAIACALRDAQTARGKVKKTAKKQQKKQTGEELKRTATTFRRLCAGQKKEMFDEEESAGWPLFQKAFQSAQDEAIDHLAKKTKTDIKIEYSPEETAKEIERIARKYAKLDGYDVMLRTLESIETDAPLPESKCWSAPVRVYARNDEWQSRDGKIKGSHDDKGQVRPEYESSLELYDEKDNLIDGLLDPDCIEARTWNLSAGQYKPFTFAAVKSDKSVAEMIRELKDKEQKIVAGLDRLLAMVEGRE